MKMVSVRVNNESIMKVSNMLNVMGGYLFCGCTQVYTEVCNKVQWTSDEVDIFTGFAGLRGIDIDSTEVSMRECANLVGCLR